MGCTGWSDAFIIGIDELDGEHRILIDMITAIFTAAEQGEAPHQLGARADDFLTLFVSHIAKENVLLARLSDPAGIAHRNSHVFGHSQFLGQARSLRDRLEAGDASAADVDRLAVLLTLEELIRADFEMVGHLKREGILAPGDVLTKQ